VAALVHHEVDVGTAGGRRVQLLPVALGPISDDVGILRVGVDADDDTGPPPVAVGEGGGILGNPGRRAVDRVHVHRRVPGRQRPTVLEVHFDGFVADLAEEVRPPVPLEARWVEGVECTLKGRKRHLPHADQQRRAEVTDGGKHAVGPVVRPRVAPDDGTSPATPEFLGERWRGGDRNEPNPAAQFLWQRRQDLSIPAHYRWSVFKVVEDWTTDDRAVLADGMTVEREGRNDPEVPTTATERPIQIWVRVGAGGHELAVRQDDVG